VIGRWATRATAAVALAVLVGGVPLLLIAGFGWPLPSRPPSWDQIVVTLTSPPSQRLVGDVVALLGWLTWASFLVSLAADLLWAARRGLRQPRARRPLRRCTHALIAALITGSLTGTTTAAAVAVTAPAPPVAAHWADHQPRPPAAVVELTAGTIVERQPAPAGVDPAAAVRRIALWSDPPPVLADAAGPSPLHLRVADTDQRHTVRVEPGDTLWDLAAAWLGDPMRWPEIQDLNRDRYPTHGGAHIEPEWTLVLPADATPPATRPAGQSDDGDGEGGDGEPGLVHDVAEGDWMWHIADRYLGDPQRYPEIAALNPTYAQQYPGWPDHIEPGDELILPHDAHDSGPRRHATGDVAVVGEPPAPQPPPAAEPEPPTASPSPPDGHPGSPTPQPPPPVTPADPDRVVPDPAPTSTPDPTATASEPTGPPTPAASPQPSADTGPAGDDDGGDQPADGGGDGVVLGDGSWIPWVVAAAVAAAMAVVWLQRRRRYRPHRLDQADADTAELYLDPDPAAGFDEPAAVSRIRRALRTRRHGQASAPVGEPEPGPEPDPVPGSAPKPQPRLDTAPPTPAAGTGHHEPPAPAPTPVAVVEPLPEGGIGIVGPGAEAAARGALVAALSAGAPVDPDAQTEVILPAETMVTLLGADAVTLGTWQRLRVAGDQDAALAAVEARLLATARLLDEYETEDLAALRTAAPAERPMPPLLLIAATPDAGARMRARNALGLGTGLGVSALLLGAWDHGPTIHIEADGTCRPATGHSDGDLPPGIPPRMAVLDQQAALELLATLREAHTGQAAPPAAAGPTPPPATAAGTPTSVARGDAAVPDEKKPDPPREDTRQPGAEPAEPASTPTGGEPTGQEQEQQPRAGVPTATVRVLGVPEIDGWQKAGRPLRKAAVELLTYLACHPGGAAPEQIQEDLWPDSRRRLAATKLHTAASNLRHLLAAAAGADQEQAGAYVHKEKGRYRIPAGPVEIDLWTLQRECARARAAIDPAGRLTALRRACQAYRGELAAGRDYEWVTVHREAARTLALDAHTTLAGLVADEDPGEAARLLLAAVQIDPMAEAVYRQAMHAYHRIGDPDTIRHLLRQLASQLEAVGGEPADETIELAEKLRAELHQQPRPSP
jgi:DNA-binding SARP family transcriptional activator/nucleoid-associated protein YgaU